ncbi:MAG: N-6 DNA methylase [Cytophagales bacterium]|nr:N-6 DNA methylase [Cytophagales bacterium]
MLEEGTLASGLVAVQESSSLESLSVDEFISVESARKYKADFVYFRKFENRPSIPQVFIYDFTTKIESEHELINLHRQLYSAALVPMFFVFTKKDVRIFNCFDSPSKGDQLVYKPLKTIAFASELSKAVHKKTQKEYEAFSARYFDNGTFWEESKYSSYFKFSNSAYEKLLTELKQALRDIIKSKMLPATVARKVMVTSILIRYLEEREDNEGRKVFPEEFFARFVSNGQNFTDVFAVRGAYLKLLDYLAKHFNGGIFQVDDKIRQILSQADLSRFGLFLEGKAEGMQRVLWKLYSFNDLPVELISNIYEEFLGKQPGVVYTPPFLVNFLLDEAMPLQSDVTDFKILDPACGSGVFLVGAFRRLIHRWRANNNWENPSLSTLKKLLKKNIFGVELNEDAADLTIFSLSLALCDELTPLQIWEELQFDNLREDNIIYDDFFRVLGTDRIPEDFDLIIGNPPFEEELTHAAKLVDNKAFIDRNSTFQKKSDFVKLPGNQISLLFLEQSLKHCKKGGLICQIQPTGPLLYNNTSVKFRRLLLESYHVPQIIDFTHINRILFGKKGDVGTAAIFLQNQSPSSENLLHVTVRRTKPHKEKLFFELDSYDFHYIPRQLALDDSLIWKSNFIGGARVHHLINRLSKSKSLKEYLSERVSRGWVASEGFTAATSRDIEKLKRLSNGDDEDEFRKFEKKLSAPFISNKRFLPTEALTNDGIKRELLQDHSPTKYFHSKGKKNVYEAPHILIKEAVVDMSVPMAFCTDDLSFKHRIVGIHAPEESKQELRRLYEVLSNSKVNLFYFAGTSSEFMINRSSAFLKKDLDNFRIPDEGQDFLLSEFENILINDFWKFLLEFRRKGETSKILTQDADLTDLHKFQDIYCKILSKIYPTIRPYEHFETNSFICCPFYFGEKSPQIDFSNTTVTEQHLQELVRKSLNTNLRLTRIVRMYNSNVIYLIKPKKLRYWLQSIALRDADETFTDLRKQGY